MSAIKKKMWKKLRETKNNHLNQNQKLTEKKINRLSC